MAPEQTTYVLAGGGTGGHVLPAIAVAREIRRQRPNAELLFVGTRAGLEAVVAPKEGLAIEFVASSGFAGVGWRRKAAALADLARGIFQARRILRRTRARAVLGMGGYASLPVLLAARLSGIPTMIQEQNSVPGLANRLAGRLARVRAVGFGAAADHFRKPCINTGNPVREEFFQVSPLSPNHLGRNVLLFGGSQGSRALNRALREAFPRLREAGVSIVAQTGEREIAPMREAFARAAGVRLEAFIQEIWKEFEGADLVVSRAGALTLSELAAAGRPSLLVPFAGAAHRHQEENARLFAEAGASRILPEEELTGENLAAAVLGLLADPEGLSRMAEAARSLARPGAAQEIADLFLALPRGGGVRFLKLRRIHFAGIGGVGMSGLAEILLSYPLTISGCDISESEITRSLGRRGVKISPGHDPAHLDETDLLVITSAISENSEEVRAARARGIPVIRRAEMLAEVMRLKQGIAVAGTHGKTTTTSMIGAILTEAGFDPTILVGGRAHYLGTNARLGKGDWLVAEADEFDRSFLALTPVLAVVTNIEEDHLDCYRDLEDIQQAFLTFANRVPFYGAVFVCLDDPHARDLLPKLSRRAVTFGESREASLRAQDVRLEARGTTFSVAGEEESFSGEIFLPLPGRHNVENALAALAVSRELSIPFQTASGALSRFDGVARRFERKGERAGILVVDDYAHHPTEIEATLAAARQVHPGRRLVALFQPHLYSRTKAFARGFGRALAAADVVLVTEIYPSRESPIAGVTGSSIADAARQSGNRQALYLARKEEVLPALEQCLKPGDLLLTLGAGDVYKFGEEFLSERTA